MVHWFDRLSKAVARVSLVHEGGPSSPAEPYVFVDSGEDVILQAGPCQTTLRDNVLTRRYATQASRSNGELLTLEREATRNLGTQRASYHLAIRTERASVFDLRIDAAPNASASMSVLGVSEAGRVVQL